jgi:phage terminase large subunit-like protein
MDQITQAIRSKLKALTPEQRIKLTKQLSPQQMALLKYDWDIVGRDKQVEPPGDWSTWLLLAGRGFGKMLDVETPIPTPYGWIRLGDIRVGDGVFDEAGNVCKVLKTFDGVPERAYRVTFSDRTFIDACDEHQWVTWARNVRVSYCNSIYEDNSRYPSTWPVWRSKRKNRHTGTVETYSNAPGAKICTTQEIANTLKIRGKSNHSIPCCAPLNLPDKDLLIDPYLLGLWLGDGDYNRPMLTIEDEDAKFILSELASRGIPHRVRDTKIAENCDRYYIGTPGEFEANLKTKNLYCNKHIPSVYFRASEQQRRDLLCGLMDSDGGANSKNGVEFSNSNKALADAVVELARSLGHKPVMHKHTARYKGKRCADRYRVIWRPTSPVFKLKRKADHISYESKRFFSNLHRLVRSVKPIEPKPMRCLTVDSKYSMFLAGEGMIPTHNTRTICEWARKQAEEMPGSRGALVARTPADVRDVLVEGESGLLNISPAWFMPEWEPSKRRLTWPNGSMATTFSAFEPEALRGPQHHWAICDELGSWKFPEAWDMLMFGLRLGANPRCAVATTPRPVRVIRELLNLPTTAVTKGTTYENRANLAEMFFQHIISKYEDTTLGRQELMGELFDSMPGALWLRDNIDKYRVKKAPNLVLMIVAIDPAVSANEDSNETGIVLVGLDSQNHSYVFGDLSGKMSPAKWGKVAVEAYRDHKADYVVAEVNQGGDLVEEIIKSAAGKKSVVYRAVRASRGKRTRAEPIAALYEQGKVHHVGVFPDLEDQMCNWLPGEESPDRMDALVWGLTELNRSAINAFHGITLPKGMQRDSPWRI